MTLPSVVSSLLRTVTAIALLIATSYSLFTQTAVIAAPPTGSLLPLLDSLIYDKDDTYTAFFSYQNDSGKPVIAPIGNKNAFAPDIENRGQPTSFVKGLQEKVFSVALVCGTTVTWSLTGPDGKINKATAAAPLCTNKDIAASCISPTGWIEDKTRRSETTATYWVAREPNTPADVTPQSKPGAFQTVLCSFSQKKYYKNTTTGNFEGIFNEVSEKKSGRFAYQSSGNDYIAQFATDPNNGFEFVTAKGVSFGVKSVLVDEKPLSWDTAKKPILNKNTITYENVLPDTDLRYILDNEGITKFFVLKSAAALTADFAKIEFVLSDSTKPIIKTNIVIAELEQKITTEAAIKGKTRLNSQAFDAELKKSARSAVALGTDTDLTFSKTIEAQIDTQISEKVTQIGSQERLKTLQTKDPSTLSDTERQQSKEYADLSVKKMVVQEKSDALAQLKTHSAKLTDYQLKTEVERIQNLGAQFDTLTLDDTLKILPPSTIDANPNSFNNESSAVSNNGKTLTIYPSQAFLRSSERQFPIMIDPAWLVPGSTQDAFITMGYPNATRGANNRHQLGVGSNYDIYAPGNGGYVGHTYTLLQFHIPDQATTGSSIIQSQLVIRQYGMNGSPFTIDVHRLCHGFYEWSVTWNTFVQAKVDSGCESIGVIGNINTVNNNSGNLQNVWSSNIVAGLRDSLNSGVRDINLMLADNDWNGGNRGIAFCSKDGGLGSDPNGSHVCNGSGGVAMEILLNNPPDTIGLAAPANTAEAIGTCNISDGTGDCRNAALVHYTMTNVNDGDGGCTDAGWYLRTHTWFQTKNNGNDFYTQAGPEYGQCGTVDRDYTLLNGVYVTTARGNDRSYDSPNWSNFNTYAVDTSAPIGSTFGKQREFIKDQIFLTAPTFGDNTFERYAFVYDNILKNINQLIPTISPGLQLGFDSAASTGALKNMDSATTQIFPDFVGTRQSLRWNNDRTLCVTLGAVGQAAVLAPCDGRETQWIMTTATGQMKLKNSAVCLEVENGGFVAGTRAIAAPCNTNPTQTWKLQPKPRGSAWTGFQIINFWGNSANMYQLQLHDFNGQLRGMDPGLASSYGDVNTVGTIGNANFWRDGLYSVESNGQIRIMDGKCLDIGAPNKLLTYDCNGGANQKWYFTAEGEIKSDYNNTCIDIDAGNAFHTALLYTAPCNGSLNQKIRSIKVARDEVFAQKYGLTMLSQVWQPGANPAAQYPTQGIKYNFQIRKVGQPSWSDTCWSDSNQLQLPNYTCGTGGSGTFAINNGDQIEVRVRAKDRTSGSANISAWQNMGITTIDRSKPIASNLSIRPTNAADYQGKKDTNGNPIENDQRISPNNNQNRKKTITVIYTFADNAPLAARLKIMDKNQVVVGYFDTCTYNGMTKPCNTYSHNFATNNVPNTVSFAWDGKDAAGNALADGKYDIQPLVYDKTCDLQNLPNTATTNCNLSDVLPGDTFVVVDNTGSNIGISQVTNNGWTNKNPFVLNGGLAGYNQPNKEDRDAYDVKICQNTATTPCGAALTDNTNFSTLTFNDIGNFSYPAVLKPGSNIFQIRSTDLAWNINDKIGDPSLTQSTNWTVNYEQNAPQILSTSITGSSTNPLVKWVLTDPNTTGNAAAVSGLNLGVNPIGYDLTLLRQQSAAAPAQEIPLYRDGINLVDPNSPQRLLSSLTCVVSPVNTAWTECTAQLNQLQLDGTYTLLLRLRDKAGNQTCAQNSGTSMDCGDSDRVEGQPYVFVVKTRVAHTPLSPTAQTTRSAKPQLLWSGQTERGATITIRNMPVGRELRFAAQPATNGTIPVEYDDSNTTQPNRLISFPAEAISITCAGQRIDDDNNPGTEPIEVCTWSLKAMQTVGVADTWTSWKTTVSDAYANKKVNDYTLITSTTSIKTTSIPDVNSFSPNGDGKLDTVTFTNTATDADDSPLTDITGTTLTIYDAADTYIWGGTASGLQQTVTWNGKNAAGAAIPDGKYRYHYVITRTIAGVVSSFVVTGQYITLLTNVGQNVAPSISTPANNSNTNRGVFSIQGQAQSSTDQNQWNINLCAHLLTTQSGADTWGTLADTQACAAPNIALKANTTSTGYYGALMALPQSQAGSYRIVGYARSSVGFVSPLSNTVTVTLDPTDAIMSATLIPNLDGINSQSDLAAYTAGTLSLDKLKTLEIKTTVSRNTELLDLDFVTYDNVGKPVANSASQTFKDANRIATISAVKDTNTALRNKQNEERIKRDLAQLYPGTPALDARPAGALMQQTTGILSGYAVSDTQNSATAGAPYKLSEARATKCTSDQCEWTIQYPYPYWISGGTFEVRFRAYKGGAVSETTRSFQINGQITSDPVMLRTDKYSLTSACITALATATPCDKSQNTSYAGAVPARVRNDVPNTTTFTNSAKNTLWFGADAYNTMLITIKNGATTYPAVPLATNINGVAKMDINLRTAPYNLASDAMLTVQVARAVSPGAPTSQYTLVYDTTAPTLTSVLTSNNSSPAFSTITNPWIKPGDSVRYAVLSSEPLFSGTVLNEVGYKGYGKKSISPLCDQFSTQAYQDNLGSSADFVMCRTQYLSSASFTSDLTVVGATETLSGVYAASIALEDIAGNLSLTTNRVWAQTLLQSNLDTSDVLRSALTTRTVIDTTFLVDGTAPTALTPAQLLIKNGNGGVAGAPASTGPIPAGYPYTPVSRPPSLDYTLLVDGTAPYKQEFTMTGWGNTQKVRDTLCRDTAGTLLGSDTMAIAKPCSVLSEKIGQQVGTKTGGVLGGTGAIANALSTADSLNADGIFPESIRTVSDARYVTRSPLIDLKGKVEKNQQVVLVVTPVGTGIEQYISVPLSSGYTNCTPQSDTYPNTDRVSTTVRGSIVTQFRDICDFSYRYTFLDTGSQGANGTLPNAGYTFSYYTRDLAGNVPDTRDVLNGGATSIRSSSLLAYHDTVAPVGVHISLSPSTPTRGYAPGSALSGSWDEYDATSDTIAAVSTLMTEPSLQSDTQLVSEQNRVTGAPPGAIPSRASPLLLPTEPDAVLRADDNMSHPFQTDRVQYGGQGSDEQGIITTAPGSLTPYESKTKYILSSTLRDEDRPAGDNCIQTTESTQSAQNPIPNRRIGVCNDGLYRIKARAIDTAGNRGTWGEKGVERDTVGPGAPSITISANTTTRTMDAVITGEAFSYVNLTGSVNYEWRLDATGSATIRVVNPSEWKYGTTYSITAKSRDRAGNTSVTSSTSYTTPGSPIIGSYCSPTSAPQISSPYTGLHRATSYFGTRTNPYNSAQTEQHDGVDFDLVNGENVVAAHEGIVSITYNDAVYGNFIDIAKPDGSIKTRYGHLSSIPIQNGVSVVTGQLIGFAGSTGRSTAAHLHFGVQVGGNWVDPLNYLSLTNCAIVLPVIIPPSPNPLDDDELDITQVSFVFKNDVNVVDLVTYFGKLSGRIIQDFADIGITQACFASGASFQSCILAAPDIGRLFDYLYQLISGIVMGIWGEVTGLAEWLWNTLTHFWEIPGQLMDLVQTVWSLIQDPALFGKLILNITSGAEDLVYNFDQLSWQERTNRVGKVIGSIAVGFIPFGKFGKIGEVLKLRLAAKSSELAGAVLDLSRLAGRTVDTIFGSVLLRAYPEGVGVGWEDGARISKSLDQAKFDQLKFSVKNQMAADELEYHRACGRCTDYNAVVYLTRRAQWDGVRKNLWKDVARKNDTSTWSASQINEMTQGRAPIGSDGNRMNIHHIVPLSHGGTNDIGNLRLMTATDHRYGVNYTLNHNPPFNWQPNLAQYLP
jgi:murein DD-endopeptidase MepM/ murein hydrolase activator NlpD